MIIEIGTSDFRTQAGQVDGVFIEPVKYYFDRLKGIVKELQVRPNGSIRYNCATHFENVAISDYEGEATMYYVDRDTIVNYCLPEWVAGCASIDDFHPSVLAVFKERGLLPATLCSTVDIKRVRIKSIIDKYNITSLDLLKIDTEGHDCIILNDYINTVEILPKVIQFEANILSDPKEVAKVCARLKPLGYTCIKAQEDMICSL